MEHSHMYNKNYRFNISIKSLRILATLATSSSSFPVGLKNEIQKNNMSKLSSFIIMGSNVDRNLDLWKKGHMLVFNNNKLGIKFEHWHVIFFEDVHRKLFWQPIKIECFINRIITKYIHYDYNLKKEISCVFGFTMFSNLINVIPSSKHSPGSSRF